LLLLSVKSTSIYSGILRLTDLSYAIADGDEVFYLIVPDKREKDVCLQLCRPAIKQNNVIINYILFSELRSHCDALYKFGESHHIMEKIAKRGVKAILLFLIQNTGNLLSKRAVS